jgi:NAD(P)-dependent dehydrogenase (short-subunit alcohol dehydrogenase family)
LPGCVERRVEDYLESRHLDVFPFRVNSRWISVVRPHYQEVVMEFAGKRVVITGSTRGIGRAAAEVLLAAGAIVTINGRTKASTQAGIEALGASERLIAAAGDVATVAGCEAIIRTAADAMGGIDVLVNAAGIAQFTSVEQSTEALWDAIVNTNLKGTFFCCRAALPHLGASRGNIVNVGSDAGLIGEKGLAVYGASKGGVVNLTRALAVDLAPDIRVNCVCPGNVDTDMLRRDYIEQAADPAAAEAQIIASAPLRRIAKPHEIGKAIAYLASDDAVFVTGSVLSIDGGTTACNNAG